MSEVSDDQELWTRADKALLANNQSRRQPRPTLISAHLLEDSKVDAPARPAISNPPSLHDRQHQPPSGRYEEIQACLKDTAGTPISQALNILLGVVATFILLAMLEFFLNRTLNIVSVTLSALCISIPLWFASQFIKISSPIAFFILPGLVCGILGLMPLGTGWGMLLNAPLLALIFAKITECRSIPKIILLITVVMACNFLAAEFIHQNVAKLANLLQ